MSRRSTVNQPRFGMRTGNEKTESSGNPKWLPVGTFLLSALTLANSIALGFFSYQVDSRLKDIQSRLNEANTKIAEFQVSGAVEYHYVIADIKGFCGSTPDVDTFKEDHLNIRNLYDGFVQNRVWDEAIKIVNNHCDWAFPRADADKHEKEIQAAELPLSTTVAFLEIRDTSSSFNPRVDVQMKSIPLDGRHPVWEYANKDGPTDIVRLGLIDETRPVRIPVALLRKELPFTPVFVPTEIIWRSPIGGQEVKLPITFIYDARHWRSIQEGWSFSGA